MVACSWEHSKEPFEFCERQGICRVAERLLASEEDFAPWSCYITLYIILYYIILYCIVLCYVMLCYV